MIRAAVADEAELALQVGDRGLEPTVGAQVAVEAPVFGVEFDERLCVVDRRLYLRFAAHDPRIA